MLSVRPYAQLPDDDQASSASSYTLSSLEARRPVADHGSAKDGATQVNPRSLERRATDGPPPRRRSLYPRWWTRRFSGWRGGTAAYTVLVAIVLLLNIVFTCWAAARFGTSKGIGTLYSGNCETTRRLSSGLHLLINVFSSAMLGGSNYCMQRLSAPTRQEVDKAHGAGTWLDIGIPSVRNVRRISWERRNLWILLALSSLPLHLLYNSAVFPQLAAFDYSVIAVSEDILNGSAPIGNITRSSTMDAMDALYWLRNHSSDLEQLSLQQCLQAYSSEIVSNRGLALLTIYSSKLSIPPHVFAEPDSPMKSCSPALPQNCYHPSMDMIFSGPYYKRTGYKAGCRSKQMEEQCELQFSVVILAVVMACNLIKLGCLLWTTVRINQPTLVTLGDAIASFLQDPDRMTKGYCMVSKNKLERGIRIDGGEPQRWDGRRWFWGATIGWQRWLIFLALCTIALIVAGFLFYSGLTTEPARGKWWEQGFGAIDQDVVLGIHVDNVIVNTLLANLPQLIFSILYLLYNAIVTAQLVGQEWGSFSLPSPRFSLLRRWRQRQRQPPRRIPLRVTVARGWQTSTYYLGIPYTYGLPLTLFSTLIHWLISRSLFLVNMKFYEPTHRHVTQRHLSRCGYSLPPIFVSILLSVLLLLAIIMSGLRRYPKGIPLAGTCSLAISAACHVPQDERKECPDLAYRPLRWGVTIEPGELYYPDATDQPMGVDGAQDLVGVGHCSFTHRDDVRLPTADEGWYMGEVRHD